MDRLYEQMRVRSVSSQKRDDEPKSTREGQAPPKKSVSFKDEKKVNWFPRQFPRQMSQGDEPSDSEFITAIAAATYAINSLEEGSLNRTMPADRFLTSLTKTKSKKEDSTLKIMDSGRISRWFSGKEAKEEKISIGSKRFSEEQGKMTGQNASAIGKPPTLRTGSGKLNFSNSGHTDTNADAWEKAKLAKIQKRCEKTYLSIVEWENKKKTKAKQRLEQKEAEIRLRRTKAVQEYNDEIARINNIAAGARAITDEKKKKDESKIRKRANEIRSTGDVPRSCFFF